MHNLADKTKPGMAALVLLAVLVSAVGLPFWVRSQVIQTQSPALPAVADLCWGCEPYERLIQLFELQQTALASEARQPEMQQPLLAQARLEAASGALVALRGARTACDEDGACRLGPLAYQQQTCGGEWPDEDFHDRLMQAADRIFALGAECRGLSCPVMNCEARSRLEGTLNALIDVLGDARTFEANANDGEDDAHQLEQLKQHLERLPLLLSNTSDGGLTVWAEELANLGANEFERRSDQAQDANWRRRLLAHQVQELVAIAAPPESEAPDWSLLGRTAGAALAQVHYLGWRAQVGDNAAQCNVVRRDRVDALVANMRRASAALAVCGARGGCTAADAAPVLAALEARGPGTVASTADFVAEGYRLWIRTLAQLDMRPDDPVVLVPDLAAYGPGEAILITHAQSTNQCLAEEGSWLGLFAPEIPQGAPQGAPPAAPQGVPQGVPQGAQREPPDDANEVSSDYTPGVRSSTDSVLFAAPDVPGSYQVRAFAPAARGGAELARVDVPVAETPVACNGFSGIWDSNFGELRLYARDGAARGSYRRTPEAGPGFLTGEVRGRRLYGTWESELGRGGARLVLSSDGSYFRGSWSHIPGQYSGTGSWTGTCRFETTP